MAIDIQARKAQTAKLLQHGPPCTILWATSDAIGGAGPIDPVGLPDGCQPVQMPTTHTSPPDPASDRQTDSAYRDKHVQQQLTGLVTNGQELTAGRPKLPFCYVMYTSGSTGSPAGVCGTETGSFS